MKCITGNMGAGKTKRLIEMAKKNNDSKVYAPIVSKHRKLFNGNFIRSREGQAIEAEFVDDTFNFEFALSDYNGNVFVDEFHFLLPKQIIQLEKIGRRIPVIIFGLLVDFKAELFEASRMVIVLSKEIERIESLCDSCGDFSSFDSLVQTEGDPINATYARKCVKCFV